MLANKDTIKALFPLELGSVSDNDIELEGKQLDALDAMNDELVNEMFANSSVELLPWWEHVFKIIPPPDVTIQQRQAAVLQAKRAKGGLSIPYFVSVAAALGFAITINELQPFMAGVGSAGDRIYIDDSIFIWQVNAPTVSMYSFRAGQSTAGERLGSPNDNLLLEKMINKLKPSHTLAIFNYT